MKFVFYQLWSTTTIPQLNHHLSQFPATHTALAEPNGLLAYGGDLQPQRLLHAYAQGIFPWYNEPPILWWSPSPRLVLFPQNLHISRRDAKLFKAKPWYCKLNYCFVDVITQCANRPKTGTWIHPEMIQAYLALHTTGHAHSVAVLNGQQIIAGLYGIRIHNVFFGESIFSNVASASKFAVQALCRWCIDQGIQLIDCQQQTPFLTSLGADEISRATFETYLL